MKRKKSIPMGDRVFTCVNILLMICLVVVMLYPFWYCIIVSFNDATDYYRGPLYLWPRKFTLENYKFVLTSGQFGVAFRNSVLRTVLGTLVHCVVTGAPLTGLAGATCYAANFIRPFLSLPCISAAG